MKKTVLLSLALSTILLTGCSDKAEKDAKPTFMFWCFRKEIISADYHVPDLKTEPAATYIQNHLRRVPGYVNSTYDLTAHTMTVRYASSTIRKMNIEETIALAGFAVNDRPANPKSKIPEGIK